MYISDKLSRKKYLGTIITYIGIASFCGLFSAVYEHFSHDVYSDSMIHLFLYPLIGGASVFAILWVTGFKYPSGAPVIVYHCGIATLTVGSCLDGIFEIYGSVSAYVIYYRIIGIMLIAVSAILCAIFRVIYSDTKTTVNSN